MDRFLSRVFPANLQALSLFRILLGLLLITDLFHNLLPFIPDLYDDGFLPRSVILQIEQRAGYISLLGLTGNPWLIKLFFTVYGIALICLVFGYRTTVAQWVVYICFSSIEYHFSVTSSRIDTIIRLLLLWSLFIPVNRYWSIDAALSRAPRDIPVPGILMAGIKLQISWVYLFGGIFKLYGASWRDGTAIAKTFNDTIYASPIATGFAHFCPYLLTPLTYVIIVFQLLFSALIYAPVFQPWPRALAIALAVLMHLSFLLLLNVGLFPYICLVYIVLLVPDSWLNTLLARRHARLEKVEIYFEKDCDLCEKIALLFREFCLSPISPVRPASDDADIQTLMREHNSWIVRDIGTTRTYMKWEAVAYVLRQSFVLWPIGVITDVSYTKNLFAHVYDWIGAHRRNLASLSIAAFPFCSRSYAPGIIAKVTCGTLIILAVTSNIFALISFGNGPNNTAKVPSVLWDIITISQAYQRWDLFAPEPRSFAYDYRMTATTQSGQTIDMRAFFEKDRFSFADLHHLIFSPYRWSSYYIRLYEPEYRPFVQQILRSLAERYNADNANLSDQISTIHIELKREPFDLFQKGVPMPTLVATDLKPVVPFFSQHLPRWTDAPTSTHILPSTAQ